MTYAIIWGREERRSVSTGVELDEVLDQIAQSGFPQAVGIYPDGELDKESSPWDEPPTAALEIGIGHPDRSFVVWLGPGGGIGYDPNVRLWPGGSDDIAFDFGGDPVFCGPDRARVTPALARQAAREFVRNGERPTCVQWAAER